MEHKPFRFGRMVRSVGAIILPLGYATDSQNCDFDESGVAKRRHGMVRRLSAQLSVRVAMLASYRNADGTGVLLYVDADGIGRE